MDFEIIFKYLNKSKFATDFMGRSQSWLAHKIGGTDSKGGFDAAEYLKMADAFDKIGDEYKKCAAEFRKQAEDKSLLINILTDD